MTWEVLPQQTSHCQKALRQLLALIWQILRAQDCQKVYNFLKMLLPGKLPQLTPRFKEWYNRMLFVKSMYDTELGERYAFLE